jgi:hypothetical protein
MSSGESFVRRPWRTWSRAAAGDGEAEGGREREAERQWGVGERAEGALVLSIDAAKAGHATAMVACALVHGGCVGFLTSTWRASVGLRWAPILGPLQAELDLGPKTKFEAHVIPSNFHKECSSIRATD